MSSVSYCVLFHDIEPQAIKIFKPGVFMNYFNYWVIFVSTKCESKPSIPIQCNPCRIWMRGFYVQIVGWCAATVVVFWKSVLWFNKPQVCINSQCAPAIISGSYTSKTVNQCVVIKQIVWYAPINWPKWFARFVLELITKAINYESLFSNFICWQASSGSYDDLSTNWKFFSFKAWLHKINSSSALPFVVTIFNPLGTCWT